MISMSTMDTAASAMATRSKIDHEIENIHEKGEQCSWRYRNVDVEASATQIVVDECAFGCG